jgi:hypothetical protein
VTSAATAGPDQSGPSFPSRQQTSEQLPLHLIECLHSSDVEAAWNDRRGRNAADVIRRSIPGVGMGYLGGGRRSWVDGCRRQSLSTNVGLLPLRTPERPFRFPEEFRAPEAYESPG